MEDMRDRALYDTVVTIQAYYRRHNARRKFKVVRDIKRSCDSAIAARDSAALEEALAAVGDIQDEHGEEYLDLIQELIDEVEVGFPYV